MHNTHTKENQNLMLNKSSLIATQKQLAKTFSAWKCNSLVIIQESKPKALKKNHNICINKKKL
jgi:hypothetical protein